MTQHDSLLGVTQALASMVAQNTNNPLPDVEEHVDGHECRFLAETAAGWVRVTVALVDVVDTTRGGTVTGKAFRSKGQ